MFVFKSNGSKNKKITFIWTLFSTFVLCNLLYWLYIFLITLSGDVEINPGPKRKATDPFNMSLESQQYMCSKFCKVVSLKIPVLTMKAWKFQDTT